jgi:hypothetical protein
MLLLRVRLDPESIRFAGYPYPGASVFPRGRVKYSDIVDVDPTATPPEVRVSGGEILFVPARDREKLESAAIEHGLRSVRRPDVWKLLLEPFVDTEYSAEHQAETLRRLEALGIARDESIEVRQRIGAVMTAYNAIHWDWVHLGLCDLLDAHLTPAVTLSWLPWGLLPNRRFRVFYRWAMDLANRGGPVPGAG